MLNVYILITILKKDSLVNFDFFELNNFEILNNFFYE